VIPDDYGPNSPPLTVYIRLKSVVHAPICGRRSWRKCGRLARDSEPITESLATIPAWVDRVVVDARQVAGRDLSKIGWIDIEDCYAAMERNGASAWTRKMAGTLLGNALRHSVKRKLIAFNPCADVVKVRPEEREMLFFTESQAKAFLAAADGRRLHALFDRIGDASRRALGPPMAR
jgi:hypothetical protein